MIGPDTAPVELTEDQRIGWLRLIRTENVGPVSFQQLLNRYGSAEAALDALPRLVQRGGAAPQRIASRQDAEDELARLRALGGRMVALGEANYPPLLRFVHGPPPLLSVIGGEQLDLGKCVSIVGARNASAAGRKLASKIADDLGRQGWIVVSGLARGIDTAAHEGALSSGTVAVFAGGIDYVYPHENISLSQAIVDQGGMLVSEVAYGVEPRARDFPRRNRIVAGMSGGTLVVEAAKRSGSLITARMALEQNREVFAVPGSPLDPRSEGTNELIRQGAMLVTGAADIVEELDRMKPLEPSLLETELDMPGPAAADDEPDQSDRDRLLNALSMTPTSMDDLIAASGLSVHMAQTILLELDLAGRIERSSGQLIALS